MNRFMLLVLSIVTFIGLSCNTNDDNLTINNIDVLIFGHFYGECIGEQCVETFMLTDEKLFEDTNDSYGGTDFNFVELDNEVFEQVSDLIEAFPSQLLNEEETTLGCPDCVDQGGLFIQYSENGEEKSWRIDQSKAAVPEYLHEFMDKVNEKIEWINN